MPSRKQPSADTERAAPKAKTSAYYVRNMRNRLQEAGLVKREFWVLPENVHALRGIEKALRQPFLGDRIKLEHFMSETGNWTISSLHKALAELDVVSSGEIVLSVPQGAEQSITLTMRDYGDLQLFIAVSGEQILVDTTLVKVSQIKDTAAFNNLVLRSRDLFPLSSVGLEVIGDDEVYCMFGALSAASPLTVVVHEVLTLAENVIHAVEAFEDHFAVEPV